MVGLSERVLSRLTLVQRRPQMLRSGETFDSGFVRGYQPRRDLTHVTSSASADADAVPLRDSWGHGYLPTAPATYSTVPGDSSAYIGSDNMRVDARSVTGKSPAR